MIFEDIVNGNAKISLIGLGYVGLPIALEFARKHQVVGFDINSKRVEMMKNGIDPSNEIPQEEFANKTIKYTDNPDDLNDCHFHIVAVPTPIDEYKEPDLRPVLSACHTVGKNLKKGDYVVFESTVYPGCTEDDCVPILEEESGLKMGVDFKVGFSPERINPGDKVNTLTNTIKIVSGNDQEALDNIAKVYELVIKAGVHRASSIKVAEAAKIIENTQRDVNISLMNELSIIFNRIGINTYEVLEAAGTKWNFLHFFPGLVGGHCIGVDPYYLVHKAKNLGYHPQVINAGRMVNDSMGEYVASNIVKKMLALGKSLKDSKVLVMGITFKENVSDIRNSKVVDLIKELRSYMVEVDVIDPFASSEEVEEEYGFGLNDHAASDYDAVIAAVSHHQYKDLSEEYFASITKEDAIFADLKGLYRNKITKLTYWSL